MYKTTFVLLFQLHSQYDRNPGGSGNPSCSTTFSITADPGPQVRHTVCRAGGPQADTGSDPGVGFPRLPVPHYTDIQAYTGGTGITQVLHGKGTLIDLQITMCTVNPHLAE